MPLLLNLWSSRQQQNARLNHTITHDFSSLLIRDLHSVKYSLTSWDDINLNDFVSALDAQRGKKSLRDLDRHDPNPLNVYCIAYPAELRNAQVGLNELISKVRSILQPDTLLVYPLVHKDFKAELWQTSARLLVIFDRERRNSEEHESDVALVDQFILHGGQVLLILSNAALANATYSYANTPANRPSKWIWSAEQHRLALRNSDSLHTCHLLSLHNVTGAASTISTNRPALILISDSDLLACPSLLRIALEKFGLQCVTQPAAPAIPLSSTPVEAQTISSSSQTGVKQDEAESAPSPFFTYAVTEHQQEMATRLQQLLGCNNGKQIASELHICNCLDQLPSGFAWAVYQQHLRTRHLGHCLLWAEVIQSSWTTCEALLGQLPADSGLVVVSDIQTQGKGRGVNRWITPRGQAAFTCHMTLSPEETFSSEPASTMGHSDAMQYVTSLQHLVALSIVLACRRLIMTRLGLAFKPHEPGHPVSEEEQLVRMRLPGPQILVKWPNDVYVVDGGTFTSSPNSLGQTDGRKTSGKLAGVLVRASASPSHRVDCIVGCGINVANRLPSVCLHDVLEQILPKPVQNLPTQAEVIATVLTQLESLLGRIQSAAEDRKRCDTLKWAMKLYTLCWMHSNQQVRVCFSAKNAKPDVGDTKVCKIIGLDAFGYLRVVESDSGTEHVLHPDGNSMDMMRNLIVAK